MISINRNGSGSTANHGMQSVELWREEKKQQLELIESYAGRVAVCKWCNSEFKLPQLGYCMEDVVTLHHHLSNGGCPYCYGKVEIQHSDLVTREVITLLEFRTKGGYSDSRDKLESHTFTINDKEYQTLFIGPQYSRCGLCNKRAPNIGGKPQVEPAKDKYDQAKWAEKFGTNNPIPPIEWKRNG